MHVRQKASLVLLLCSNLLRCRSDCIFSSLLVLPRKVFWAVEMQRTKRCREREISVLIHHETRLTLQSTRKSLGTSLLIASRLVKPEKLFMSLICRATSERDALPNANLLVAERHTNIGISRRRIFERLQSFSEHLLNAMQKLISLARGQRWWMQFLANERWRWRFESSSVNR